jgi:hypothetical protein
MKRGALIVQRQRMTCLFDAVIEIAIGQFEREQPFADAPRHFIDRQTVSRNRIPQTQKFDLLDRAVAGLIVSLPEQSQARIARPAERRLQVEHGVKQIGAVGSIGQLGILV